MKRRKDLLGLGTIAAGGAAALGTGVFTSVPADRDIEVEVSGDASAFLALASSNDPNGEYVDESGGTVTLDFTENNTVSNSGINDRAFTNFESVLEVKNQGTQDIRVGIQPPLDNNGNPEPGYGVGDSPVFVSRENLDYNTGSPSEGSQVSGRTTSASRTCLPSALVRGSPSGSRSTSERTTTSRSVATP